MSAIDKKRDAILEGLYFYYKQYTASQEIYRFTGDKSDLQDEFVPVGLLSAWLAFSDYHHDIAFLNRTQLFDFLNHLEKEKLITSNETGNGKAYKIIPEGISLLEKRGFVGRYARQEREYRLKWATIIFSVVLSIIAIVISIYKKKCWDLEL